MRKCLSLCLLYAGYLWRQSALQSHGDGLNGLVLMGIGDIQGGGILGAGVCCRLMLPGTVGLQPDIDQPLLTCLS